MPALPRAKKRFGQHFLTDRHYVDRIVRAIAPAQGDAMVEIGPGTGILTDPLAAALDHLHVVEIDRGLAGALRARFREDRVTVHEADALEFAFEELPGMLRVVGNLPYNVSTPILFRMASLAERLRDCIFMLQKEVVERMVAAPATPEYGRLSVMLQYRFEMALQLRVPPGAFTPPPKVDSAVVRMVPLGAGRARAHDERLFERIVAAAFSQRRKMLRSAVRALATPASFEEARIDASRRGETLSVAEFIALADAARSSPP
ncbi:MAG: 16S rRNA (adenine(1518)-N(6)/adenine(1519)-N(6))-dimethyltransferase RsmA [Burkholderiales bacterium]|nr:16S rRNA (adenine(1518)-N(6)/adenine(1519)-N(6))-dimethyltransferase RsmA [Burkholderiales bacterium]